MRMHDSRFRRFVAAWGILGAAVTLSCGETPTATTTKFGPPAALQIVTGRSQVGGAGQTLPEPLTVQVLDAAGHGLRGLAVTWTISGGGTLYARAVPTVTDSTGLVMVFWQLGPTFGTQQVIAHCAGLDAGFSAQAQLPLSQRVGMVSGYGQTATVGTPLTYPIVIQVLKADGTFDTGVPVSFRAISHGSTYAPADTVTNSVGQAGTVWTLGTVAGVESTAVFVRGLPPVLITAYGYPGPPARLTITERAFPTLGPIGDTVWAHASAWDQYDNPILNQGIVFHVADTLIAQVALITYNAATVAGRHHGSTFVTAQLGSIRDSVPLSIMGFSSVTVGGSNICATSVAGDAYCWGGNSDGGIGDGTRIQRPHPVLIGTGLGLTTLSTDWHTCGLNAGGQAYCWGYGAEGQLGDGSPDYATESRVLSPVAVAGGHLFVSIKSGRRHTCAVATNGDAYCWGGNWAGQLGRDTATNTCWGTPTNGCSDWPILVSGGLQFANVSASIWEHSCGVTTSGDAYCWGANASGQLGNDSTNATCGLGGSYEPCIYRPLRVEGGISFTSVSTGDYFTCGLSTSGDGFCWGYNYYGQLGNGTFTNSHVPVKVSGGLTFADVQSSSNTACGLTSGGKVYCWGGSFNSTPKLASDTVFTAMAVGTDGGSTRVCAVTPGNDLYCWYQAIF